MYNYVQLHSRDYFFFQIYTVLENEGRPDRASLMEELRRPKTSAGNSLVACWIRLVRNYIRVKRWVKKTRELGCLGHTGSGIRMAGGGVHDPLHDSRQRGSEILSNLPISCEVDAAERAAPVRSELRMQHWKPVRSLIGIRRSSFLQKRHVSP